MSKEIRGKYGVYSFDKNADTYIGRGALGEVYLTEDRNSVVKVATNNAAFRERLQQEYDFNERLYQQQLQLTQAQGIPIAYTPLVDKDQNDVECQALVMPYYQITFLKAFQQVLNDNPQNTLAAERLALQGALQYLTILEALEILDYTCLDRKINDLFWWTDPQTGTPQLVVIDWNILQDNRPENQQAQLIRFAQLWFEITTGNNPRPPFLPFDDRSWLSGYASANPFTKTIGAISVGFRLLLRDTLEVQQAQVGEFYQEIRHRFKKWLEIIQYQQASRLEEVFEADRFNLIERQAIQADLEARWNLQKVSLLTVREEHLQKAQLQMEGQIQIGMSHIESGDYEAARAVFDSLMQRYPSDQRLKRWVCLVQALRDDNYYGNDYLRRERGALITAVEAMNGHYNVAELAGAYHHLNTCLQRLELPKVVKENLNQLMTEAAALLTVEQYRAWQLSVNPFGRFELAANLLNAQAQIQWVLPTVLPDLQHDTLEKSVPSQSMLAGVVVDLQASQNQIVYELTDIIERNYLNPRYQDRLEDDLASLFHILQQLGLVELELEVARLLRDAHQVIGYLVQFEKQMSFPEADLRLTHLKGNRFFRVAEAEYQRHMKETLYAICALGTLSEPRWVTLEDYDQNLRAYLDPTHLEHFKAHLGHFQTYMDTLSEEHLKRARQVWDFCEEVLPKLREQQADPHQALPDLVSWILHTKVNISGAENFEQIAGGLADMFGRWTDVLAELETKASEAERVLVDLENKVVIAEQKLRDKLEESQTVTDGLLEEFKEFHFQVDRFRHLQRIWGAIATMKYDYALQLIQHARDRQLLQDEDIRRIDKVLDIVHLKVIRGEDLYRMYETLVVRGQALKTDDRYNLRQVAAQMHRQQQDASAIDRLLDLDALLRMEDTTAQRFDLYKLLSDDNNQLLLQMRQIIKGFLNLIQEGANPQLGAQLDQLEKYIDVIKPSVATGGVLLMDGFMYWYQILQAVRRGLSVIDANAKLNAQQRLDKLVELCQYLPEVAFYILYNRWKYAFSNTLNALIQDEQHGAWWQAQGQALIEEYRQTARMQADIGHRILSKYQTFLVAKPSQE